MMVLFVRSVEVAVLLVLLVPLLTMRMTVMERAVGTAFDSMCSLCSTSHPSRAAPTRQCMDAENHS